MKIGEAFVEIRADLKGFKRDLDTARKESTKAGKGIADEFQRFIKAAAFGAGIKKSIDAASNLNETVAKTKVVFGDASEAMEKNAAAAAKTMGLSKRAYLDSASALKLLLDAQGLNAEESTRWSETLTGLTADLASFYNASGGAEEVSIALAAALRGEMEPARRFGIMLDDARVKAKAYEMGLYSGKGAIDANAKSQATLALIMEQTAVAQGDFARTADGAANSSRTASAQAENAAASFGQVLLPIYTRVVQVLGFLAEGFGKLPAPIQVAFVALAGFAALGGPVSNLVGTFKAVTTAVSGFATATKVSLGVIGLLLTAAGFLYETFSDGNDKTADVAEATANLADSLKASTAELLLNAEAIRKLKGELPDTSTGFTALSNAVVDAMNAADPGSGDRLQAMLGDLGLTTQEVATAMLVTKDAIDSNSYSYGELAAAVFGITKEQVEWLRSTTTAAGAMTEAEVAAAGLNVELFRQRDKILAVERGATDLRIAFKDTTVDVKGMAKAFIDQARGASDLTQNLVGQAEAQAAANGQGGDAVAIYLEYVRLSANLSVEQQKLALDLDAAAASNAQLAEETEGATEAAARQKAANQDLRDAVADTTTAFDEAADAADKLREAIDAVFAPTMNFEEANRKVLEGTQALTDQFNELDENGVRYAATLDINTQRGRENRAAVQEQANAILDFGVAMVGAGYSTEDAAANVQKMTADLSTQLQMLGLTKEEADAYIASLGLTPENVETSINLANDAKAKEKLADLLEQLGDIDEGSAAEIQALVDQGKFDEAEAKIKEIAKARNIPLKVSVSGSGNIDVRPAGSSFRVVAYAQGGYADKPTAGIFGEAGPEAILPLSKPARLRALLGDPRIAGPVAAALSGGSSGTESAGASPRLVAAGGGVVNHNHFYLYGIDRAFAAKVKGEIDRITRGG